MMLWMRQLVPLIKRLIKAELASVHTNLPAQVVSYTTLTNLCSIQPCIMRLRSEDPENLTTVQLPQIDDVPVKQFGSGKCLLSIAPQVGSYGLFHVSERSIENWLVQGGITDPKNTQKFDISDGFFDPGIYPIKPDGDKGLIAVPVRTDRIELRTRLGTSYVSVVDDGSIEIAANSLGLVTIATTGEITLENAAGSITLKTTGVTEINASTDAASLASKVDLFISMLDTVFRTAWVVAPMDGGAALKATYIAAFAIPPATVASTKLKVDS